MRPTTWWVLMPALMMSALALAQVPVRAQQAIAAGNFEKALKLLDLELGSGRRGPAVADLQLQRAACFHALGQSEQAELAAVAALEQRPEATFPAHQASPALLELVEKARRRVLASVVVRADHAASVRIDGSGWGPAPLTLELEVGRHLFEVQYDDGASVTREVVIEYGRENVVAIEQPPPAEAAPQTARSTSRPLAAPEPLPPVLAPKPPQAASPLEAVEAPSRSRALPVAVLISGLVLASAGGAAFGWAQSHKSQVESGLATRREAEGVLGANAAGIGALVLGGGMILTSVVLFVLTGREVHLTAVPSSGGGLWALGQP